MKHITASELKQRIDAGENIKIIDVREPAEYAENNMGGMLLPLGSIANMQIDDIDEFKNEELIIHCKGGTRSMQACLILEQVGFSNLVNLTGGITAWQKL
jgi:rhodanese-related sulfurtransferase